MKSGVIDELTFLPLSRPGSLSSSVAGGGVEERVGEGSIDSTPMMFPNDVSHSGN